MSDHDLRQIGSIVTERQYPKGAVIIEERTEAERFFIICHGKIEITKRFEGDQEFVLAVQSDGDFFGEMALLDEGPRSATARALEDTTVLEVSSQDFEGLLYRAPTMAYHIMKELSSRLRETGALLIAHLKQRHRLLYRAYIDTISMITAAVARDQPRRPSLDPRNAALARAIGRELELGEDDLLTLELGALVRDLGMLAVPEELLRRPGPLEGGEYATVKGHARAGSEMIKGIPFLEEIAPQIFSHHERFDGTGYPQGLSGEAIPLESRIIAVVDAFAAMTEGRPYRGAISAAEAVAEIRGQAGKQFDPRVVQAFLKVEASGGLPSS
jgi:HD-GYP domain-containing protein (c-di-GMP phosphodiesterase class II)